MRKPMSVHVLATWAAVSLLSTAACSSPAATTTAVDAPARPNAPKVPRLVFGIAPPGNENNKVTVAATTDYWPMAPMYDFLIGATPEGKEMVPELATEWRLGPEGRSFRFKLRNDVPFHGNFGNVGAADVRKTWLNVKEETDVMPPAMTQFLQLITNVEVAAEHEVVIQLARPDAGFLLQISKAENTFPIVSARDAESRSRPPAMQDKAWAGTGPYEFLAREQSRFLRFKRSSDRHWQATPEFLEFEYRFIKEDSTRLAALLARELQVAALPPEMIPQATTRGFKSIAGRAPGQQIFLEFVGVLKNQRLQREELLNPDPDAPFVYMNTPLLDPRVRKALNKAINRDALNKAFVQGRGDPIFNLYFNPDRAGWNPAWKQRFNEAYGYDPEAARRLLAEAGYGPGKPLGTTVQIRPIAYFPAASDITEAVANYWKAVGVNAALDQSDPASMTAKSRRLEYDNHVYPVVTSIRQLRGAGVYNSATLGNRNGVQLPELDQLLREIQVTLDPKRSDELWRQWGDIAYDQHVNIPLFWLPTDAVVDPSIVADYVFPGSITGSYTHVEHIKAAK